MVSNAYPCFLFQKEQQQKGESYWYSVTASVVTRIVENIEVSLCFCVVGSYTFAFKMENDCGIEKKKVQCVVKVVCLWGEGQGLLVSEEKVEPGSSNQK